MKIPPLLLALFGFLPLHAGVVSSVERLDPDAAPWSDVYPRIFQGGGPYWSGSTFLFASAPDYLLGAELVRTRFSDNLDADVQLRITLDAPATLYLFIDDFVPDVAATMPWVSALGFADTGDDLFTWVGSSVPRQNSIYAGNFPAGDVTLFQQNAPGNVGMYVAAAAPEPASVLLALTGAVFCVPRRLLRKHERNT